MARIMKLLCKLWKRGHVTGTIHDVREVLSRFSVRTCLVPSTAWGSRNTQLFGNRPCLFPAFPGAYNLVEERQHTREQIRYCSLRGGYYSAGEKQTCVCVTGTGTEGAYLYQVTLQKRQESDMNMLVSSSAYISLLHHFLFELWVNAENLQAQVFRQLLQPSRTLQSPKIKSSSRPEAGKRMPAWHPDCQV